MDREKCFPISLWFEVEDIHVERFIVIEIHPPTSIGTIIKLRKYLLLISTCYQSECLWFRFLVSYKDWRIIELLNIVFVILMFIQLVNKFTWPKFWYISSSQWTMFHHSKFTTLPDKENSGNSYNIKSQKHNEFHKNHDYRFGCRRCACFTRSG